MNRVSTWFHQWNGFALKGQHTRRVLGNLYFSAILFLFFVVISSGMFHDYGAAEGYQLLILENVLGLVVVTAVLGMMEMSLAERQGLALNLAQSDLEQFHSSYGFGLACMTCAVVLINVLTLCVNGLLFGVWKSWQECVILGMRCIAFYAIFVPTIYAKDFRVRQMGNLIIVGIVLILAQVGNGFLKAQIPFWGAILLISLAYSYGLGRRWHCRHEKG